MIKIYICYMAYRNCLLQYSRRIITFAMKFGFFLRHNLCQLEHREKGKILGWSRARRTQVSQRALGLTIFCMAQQSLECFRRWSIIEVRSRGLFQFTSSLRLWNVTKNRLQTREKERAGEKGISLASYREWDL